MKNSIDRLLANNKAWAARCLKENPRYFQDLVDIQKPQYLWIGCSDARVPANTIVDLNPGEVFVHRNIANQIQLTDLNCISVITFAVEFLKVKDIIVTGHYGCGGVRGALEGLDLGIINNWLVPIKDLAKRNEQELNQIPDFNQRHQKLCELNVHQQVFNVCRTDSVQKAWASGQPLSVHGLVYDLHDGYLTSLDVCISSSEDMKRIPNVS